MGIDGSSGGVVVKLLACRASGPGLALSLTATISEIGHLLLPNHDLTEYVKVTYM